MHDDQLVGKLYRDDRTRWAPGSFFTMVGGDCTLTIFWEGITREDVWRVANGKISFGVWYSDDKDLFFLYRLEGCHWSDVVFSAMQLPEERRVRPPFMRATEKLMVRIFLVSTENGIIQAARTLLFSHPLSKKLCLAVDKHFYANYAAAWSPEAFDSRVNKVYQKYPLPELLTRAQGCILCTGQEGINQPQASPQPQFANTPRFSFRNDRGDRGENSDRFGDRGDFHDRSHGRGDRFDRF